MKFRLRLPRWLEELRPLLEGRKKTYEEILAEDEAAARAALAPYRYPELPNHVLRAMYLKAREFELENYPGPYKFVIDTHDVTAARADRFTASYNAKLEEDELYIGQITLGGPGPALLTYKPPMAESLTMSARKAIRVMKEQNVPGPYRLQLGVLNLPGWDVIEEKSARDLPLRRGERVIGCIQVDGELVWVSYLSPWF